MNRLLAGEPLDARVLTTTHRAENPFPAEAALLAHCLIDPSRVDQIVTITVTPPCSALLDLIKEFGVLAQTGGLASLVLNVYDPIGDMQGDVTRKPILEHIDVYDLATLVDSIRVVELTAIGDFLTVVMMMRGQLKPAEKKKSSRFGKAESATIAGLDMAVGQ